MKLLRLTAGYIARDGEWNNRIRNELSIILINEKIIEYYTKWKDCLNRQP